MCICRIGPTFDLAFLVHPKHLEKSIPGIQCIYSMYILGLFRIITLGLSVFYGFSLVYFTAITLELSLFIAANVSSMWFWKLGSISNSVTDLLYDLKQPTCWSWSGLGQHLCIWIIPLNPKDYLPVSVCAGLWFSGLKHSTYTYKSLNYCISFYPSAKLA